MLPPSFSPSFLKQLELLKIYARRKYIGAKEGGHISLKRGHGVEFADYRKYVPGDYPRYIDWNVFARSERLYVKCFQEERDLSVLCVLDSSSSMTAVPEDAKFERAKELVMALSYIALMTQDRVTLAVLGSLNGIKFGGPKSFYKLVDTLNKGRFESKSLDLTKDLSQVLARVRFPGMAMFFSDFLMPIEQINAYLDQFRSKNLDLTVFQMLGASDLKPFNYGELVTAIDSETGESLDVYYTEEKQASYKDLLAEHNNRVHDLCARLGVRLIQVMPDDTLQSVVFEKLVNSGLLG